MNKEKLELSVEKDIESLVVKRKRKKEREQECLSGEKGDLWSLMSLRKW